MVTSINPTNIIPPVTTIGTENNIANLEIFETLVTVANGNSQTPLYSKTTPNTQPAETAPIQDNLLNLSPQALNFLNGIDGTIDTSASTAFNNSLGFSLSAAQQQQLSNNIAQFSNSPFNANSYAQLQAAMTAAGIDPTQFSLQEVFQGILAMSSSVANENGYAEGEILANDQPSELLFAA